MRLPRFALIYLPVAFMLLKLMPSNPLTHVLHVKPKRFVAAFLWLTATAYLPAAQACTSCLCGDPTLTTLGTEKPYAGRTQFGWEAIYREEETGQGVNLKNVTELRHTLNASYWPTKKIGLAFSLPVHSTLNLTVPNGADQQGSGVGDLAVNGRYYVKQTRRYNTGVIVGMRLPTGSEQKTASGQAIDIDAQPAQGIYQARLGGWFSRYRYPWSFHGSAIAYAGLNEGYQGFEAGNQLTLSGIAQYATTQKLSVMWGVEARTGAYDTFNGERDNNSGGTIAYAVLGVVGKWGVSGLWHIKAQSEAYNGLNGQNEEPFVIYTGVGYGF